jgi:intracellular sulfur oxidation DsrE/DsrF family protein
MKLGKILATILLPVAMVLSVALGADANERYGTQKVVYHINYPGGEGDKAYLGAMRNIQNHINAVGKENMEIKVVLHGNGIGLLQDALTNEKVQGAVVGLKGQSVAFQVCNNTLVGKKLNYETDLFDVFAEDIVPSGVAELSRLQQMGFTYIKP